MVMNGLAYKNYDDYWRFTTSSARYIFEKKFDANNVTVEAFGNVFASICFLEGISKEEITEEELDHYDSQFPLLITARAQK